MAHEISFSRVGQLTFEEILEKINSSSRKIEYTIPKNCAYTIQTDAGQTPVTLMINEVFKDTNIRIYCNGVLIYDRYVCPRCQSNDYYHATGICKYYAQGSAWMSP